MKFLLSASFWSLALIANENVDAFGVAPSLLRNQRTFCTRPAVLYMSAQDAENIEFSSEEEKNKMVGNLVEDDEWNGLGMELTESIRLAISEDIKRNAREFIGKDEYKVGDITKEVDARVKDELAKFRGKEEYELGDFTKAMDEMSKKMVEDFTGKPYETGDLSSALDMSIKSGVAKFCGKDTYEFGDLSNEIDGRVKDRVSGFTGKADYEFGDISNEIESRRQEWAKEFLGEEAASNYVFGDLTKKSISNWTGKDDYQFGDVTKKLAEGLFGKKKK